MKPNRREEIVDLLLECSCTNLKIQIGQQDGRLYLQIADAEWTGRKWILSDHMTDGEVVQTAMAAVLAWYEHEAREAFKFRGKAIFNPHLSLEALCARAEEEEHRL
jgi:hypothetical protein